MTRATAQSSRSTRAAPSPVTSEKAGIARLGSLGIEISDYSTLMVEIMGDNAVPEAGQVYGALDMPFATLMGQVAASFEK